MTPSSLRRRTALLLLSLMLWGGTAVADEDHDEALRAVKQGAVRPLAEIIAGLEEEISGKVIEIEFERKDERYVYEIRVLTPDGRLHEIYVDAENARVLERESD